MDEDNRADVAGRDPGYFGYIFLESPGNPYDQIDNDGDGIVDESRYNGIDDDGDWDVNKHDVGVDGIPNTGDSGEYDGFPTAGNAFDIRQPGEPNFEWTDLDESDMIGLTSFAAPNFGGNNRISKDDFIYGDGGRFVVPYDARPWIHEIHSDTLVITGGKDKLVPEETSNEVIKRLNTVKSKVINDAGHSVPWTHADELLEEINSFLNNE